MIRPILSFVIITFLCGCQNSTKQMPGSPPPTGWKLVWNDEFDGKGVPDSSNWSYAVGGHGWGNKEKQFYTEARAENAGMRDGKLHVTARQENGKTTTTPPHE